MFPFTGGGPSAKIFFSSLNMYQAKSDVKNVSLYCGGGTRRWGTPWRWGTPQRWGTPWRWGTPLSKVGYPPIQGWGTPLSKVGYTPPSKVGVPPCPRLDWDPPIQGWIRYPPRPRLDRVPPPPPTVEVWTDKLKTVPSPILRMRAVKIEIIQLLTLGQSGSSPSCLVLVTRSRRPPCQKEGSLSQCFMV